MAANKKKLKVYRTAIGFHDAYVATPSKKAALEAWGTTKDLFARKAAEIVEDPALTTEPLARPGEVIKRLRGTTAEQIAALPERKPKAKAPKSKTEPAKAAPRPSRDAVDTAEQALNAANERYARDLDALRARERELAEQRRKLEKQQARECGKLEEAAEAARSNYETKLRAWRG